MPQPYQRGVLGHFLVSANILSAFWCHVPHVKVNAMQLNEDRRLELCMPVA